MLKLARILLLIPFPKLNQTSSFRAKTKECTQKYMTDTISQIKSDERFKSETEGVYKHVHDRDRILEKGDVSFKNGNWYETATRKTTKYHLRMGIGIILLFCPTYVFAENPAPYGFADTVEKLLPAVVNISTTQKIKNRPNGFPKGSPFEEFNEFFERFGMPPGMMFDENMPDKKAISLGSGFIIDQSGYVVTNNHVIEGAEEIQVILQDERKFKAKIIGSDAKTDLALLKIESDKALPSVRFGESDKTRVGDWILAIGNPFGLGGTVTTGIVSAKARDINAGPFDDFIQTDAAINKGNSGGPMFSLNGEVIGINTAIYSPSGGSVGIGFATPSSIAQPIIEQLKAGKKIKRAYIGVKIQPVTEDIAESLGLKEAKGAIVMEITKDSPAEKSGLKISDIITHFDDKEINAVKKLPKMVAETNIGQKTKMSVIRKGEQKTLYITPEELKEPSQIAEAGDNIEPETTKILGMSLIAINDELIKKYALDKGAYGLIITKIDNKSDAYKKGIRRGDIISSINQEPVRSIEEFNKIVTLSKKQNRKSVMLMVNRESLSIIVPVAINEK